MKIYFLNSRELDSFSSLFLNVIPFRVCVSIAVKKKLWISHLANQTIRLVMMMMMARWTLYVDCILIEVSAINSKMNDNKMKMQSHVYDYNPCPMSSYRNDDDFICFFLSVYNLKILSNKTKNENEKPLSIYNNNNNKVINEMTIFFSVSIWKHTTNNTHHHFQYVLITHYSRIALVHNDHHHYEPENDENQDGKYIQAIAAVISKRTVFFLSYWQILTKYNIVEMFPCFFLVCLFFFIAFIYIAHLNQRKILFFLFRPTVVFNLEWWRKIHLLTILVPFRFLDPHVLNDKDSEMMIRD